MDIDAQEIIEKQSELIGRLQTQLIIRDVQLEKLAKQLEDNQGEVNANA